MKTTFSYKNECVWFAIHPQGECMKIVGLAKEERILAYTIAGGDHTFEPYMGETELDINSILTTHGRRWDLINGWNNIDQRSAWGIKTWLQPGQQPPLPGSVKWQKWVRKPETIYVRLSAIGMYEVKETTHTDAYAIEESLLLENYTRAVTD